VLQALRIGLVQITHLDRIPDHAAVDESVSLTRFSDHDEKAGLVNAILRRAASGDLPPLPESDDDLALSVRHSFPIWLLRRWRRFDDRLVSMLEGSNRTPDLVLRVNASRTTRDAVLRDLEASGVACEPGRLSRDCIRVKDRFDLARFPGFLAGEVSVQDESEALVTDLVDPLPTERVLDACAAPGGKSCHVLERTEGLAQLTAMDVSRVRLGRLIENLVRLRFRSHVVVGDARFPPLGTRFDRVLVDAPCTGTGVLARRAEARWRLDSRDPAAMGERQLVLLTELSSLVTLGGVLVYSVCSIEPEETTDVVERFLSAKRGYREEVVSSLPQRARDPVGHLRLLPGDAGSDGVFGVRLRRVA
jgi:16S rRNA (cytosine967-C5)-methyltransferase